MKHIRIVPLAIIVITSPLFGQFGNREPDPTIRQAFSELRASIADYAKSNILPQMLSWKSQLDAALSQDDLIALDALRKKAAALRSKTGASTSAMRKAWKTEDYDKLKQSRETIKSLGAERKDLLQDLKPIAVKYRDVLEKLGKQAKPQMLEWKEHGKALFSAWHEKHADALQDRGRHMGMGMQRAGVMGFGFSMNKEGQRKRAAVRFLLWDGSDFTERIRAGNQDGGALEPEDGATPGRSGFGLEQSYPNPVGTPHYAGGSASTIRFSLPASEYTTVKVYDSAGKEVASLLEDSLPAGNHFVNFDPEDLPSGMYFVHLNAGELSDIKPLHVVK